MSALAAVRTSTVQKSRKTSRIPQNAAPICPARAFWRGGNDGVDHAGIESAMDQQRLGDGQHRRAMLRDHRFGFRKFRLAATLPNRVGFMTNVIFNRFSTVRNSLPFSLHFVPRSVLSPMTVTKGNTMPKMTKSQLIDAISESSAVSKNDVKSVIESMAVVGYKELNEGGEFVIPGFVKMSVVNKPATEAHSGINPFTKEPMEFAAKPASKTVRASPLKAAKDAV